MLFKQYRIIFILIFMLSSDGTFRMIKANDIETTLQQHTNSMENAQSGKLFFILYISIDNIIFIYTYHNKALEINIRKSIKMISDFCHDLNSLFVVFLHCYEIFIFTTVCILFAVVFNKVKCRLFPFNISLIFTSTANTFAFLC